MNELMNPPGSQSCVPLRERTWCGRLWEERGRRSSARWWCQCSETSSSHPSTACFSRRSRRSSLRNTHEREFGTNLLNRSSRNQTGSACEGQKECDHIKAKEKAFLVLVKRAKHGPFIFTPMLEFVWLSAGLGHQDRMPVRKHSRFRDSTVSVDTSKLTRRSESDLVSISPLQKPSRSPKKPGGNHHICILSERIFEAATGSRNTRNKSAFKM